MAKGMEKTVTTPEPDDWDAMFRIDTSRPPRKLSEEKKREWQAYMIKADKQRERKKKIAEALQAEEKKTGKAIPFTLMMRYGLIHAMPAEDSDLEEWMARDQQLPEMAYYEQMAQELDSKLRAEQDAQPQEKYGLKNW